MDDWRTIGAGPRYLGGGAAYGRGPIRQTRPRRLVDVTVTRHGADAQTSQDLLQTQHDLIATLRLREEEEGERTLRSSGGTERRTFTLVLYFT